MESEDMSQYLTEDPDFELPPPVELPVEPVVKFNPVPPPVESIGKGDHFEAETAMIAYKAGKPLQDGEPTPPPPPPPPHPEQLPS